ncbi:succinylglutamate desuccinylase/aspartoacylase family protein [Colwellia sp. D2M02]|uniref:succinylglutamate desuccinylase/aspartoacylase domain-containing protein n=1 Tax=Colwellia sp. D2M02 TaxID=2841562 RepID=UPI001C094CF1|nr:succinylglutamate desuccinylase/aspartoacylase family protein [Colwellia sp. D2M02]MBU2892617.1 succinylglutamate desuccinylase/aspartoacylase family protein [Colwellia sp. D2M02]
MEIDFNEINYVTDPTWQVIHADYEQFLLSMTGPTVIDISGEDNTKCRVFVTLLQGDEPSGIIAIHRYLEQKGNTRPATKLRFIICSVEAAASRPLFSKRFTDGGIDINRCFGNQLVVNKEDLLQRNYQHRANLIKHAIEEVQPEMVIDLHNAPSSGPAFAISALVNTETLSLASFFSSTLILSDLKIGSLMEHNFHCPYITVECGGSEDEQAHEVAFAGIINIANCQHIGYIHQKKSVDVIYRPLRLQLKSNVKLSYAKHDEGYNGITLKNNIECFNFGSAYQDQMLGWVDGEGLNNLNLIDKDGTNVLADYFYIRENQLVCRHNLRLFKATNNKQKAMNDCLFYVVKAPVNEA